MKIPEATWFWFIGNLFGFICGWMAHKEKVDKEKKERMLRKGEEKDVFKVSDHKWKF